MPDGGDGMVPTAVSVLGRLQVQSVLIVGDSAEMSFLPALPAENFVALPAADTYVPPDR